MPRYIVKLRDRYMEWSTVVDAPTTYGMTLEEFRAHYEHEYGVAAVHGGHNMPPLRERMLRVAQQGTSANFPLTVEQLIAGNRAGPDEATLSEDELYRAYCLRENIREGWTP